jgi:RNA polymerase sigma factor (sigma-70 family)
MDADDMFQEMSLHILNKLEEIELNELKKWESAAWITTVCKNKCKDALKGIQNKNKHWKHTQSDDDLEVLAKDQDYTSERELWKTSLRKLLDGLRAEERKLIILRYIKGYSVKEVGELLQLSNPSVNLGRVLEKLKKSLNGSVFFDHFDGLVLEDLDSDSGEELF